MNEVCCENPRILVNPQLPEIFSWSTTYVFKGRKDVFRVLHRHKDDFDRYKHLFSPRRNHISLSDLDDCYVYDEDTGESKPIYIVVPCGKCSVCRLHKMNSFVKRCEYESQMYDSKPWFATLTYASEFLPIGGVSVRDCQLFLKRFRINLQRHGFVDRIRYVIVSEYGDDDFDPKLNRCHTQRPHYHCLFWNINSFTPESVLLVRDILTSSWNKGFVQSRLIYSNDDDKGMFYTFKYVGKGSDVPEGMNKNFILSSRRNGGIGAGFIDKVAGDIRKNLDVSYKYLDKHSKSSIPKDFVFMPYALNRIFPSFCRSVSSKFRDSVVKLVALGGVLRHLGVRAFEGIVSPSSYYRALRIADNVRDLYSPFFYVGSFYKSEFPSWCDNFLFRKFYTAYGAFCQALRHYRDLLSKVPDLCFCKDMQCLRERFLCKLFRVPVNRDVAYLSYVADLVLNSPSPCAVFHKH